MKSRGPIFFIFITLVIDIMGFGLIIPVLPGLITTLTGKPVAEASSTASFLTLAYAGMQFLCAPLIGNLSDRFGRRPVLLASIAAFIIDYLILGLATSLGWLFVGRLIAGFTGASITTAMAYIADVSSPEDRAKNFGITGAAFGVGFILGPALGGLLGGIGLKVPFYAAAILCSINFILGYFMLPESLSPENRRPFSWKRANPLGALLQFKKYPKLHRLFLVLFLIAIGSHAVQSNWSFFTIEKFQWSEKMIGLSLAMAGLMVGIVQGVLIRWVNPILGNEKSLYLGLLIYGLSMVLFAFAFKGWHMFVILIPYCLGGIAGPAAQAMITGEVLPNQQGEVQGLNTSLISLTSIIGPLLMNNLFYFTTKSDTPFYFPGSPFMLGAVLFLIGTLISYLGFKKQQRPKSVTLEKI
ncbi:MAG: TCR/Tet family MFS transporter [Saprospiraceae bacterium]